MVAATKRLAIGALALLAGGTASLAQSGVTVAYRKVIISDDPGQSGWAGVFNRMSSPAINAFGDVAFEGDTDAPMGGRGVWVGKRGSFGYTVSKILQDGDSLVRPVSDGAGGVVSAQLTVDVPGNTSTGEGTIGVSLPLIHDQGEDGVVVAFITSIQSPQATAGESVLWRTDVHGVPSVIAGAPYLKAPTFGDLESRYFAGWFNPTPFAVDYRFGANAAMPRTGDGTVAYFATLDTINSQDQSVLPPFEVALSAEDREGGVFFGATPGVHDEIVRYQDPVQGFPGLTYSVQDPFFFLSNMGTPVLNSAGDAAFWSFASDKTAVVTAYDFDPLKTPAERRRVIARDGGALPGAPSPRRAFVNYAPTINQSGAVAFRAIAVDAFNPSDAVWGVWAEDAALTLGKVILGADPVPNHPTATWTQFGFGDPVMNMNFEKAFAGRHERQIGEATVTTRGVYWAGSTNLVQRVAESAQNTPLVPNTTDLGRNVGVFKSFADPSINDTGNVVFLAGVDVTDATLASRLSSVTVPAQFIVEEAIFVRDDDDALRTIVASGMTVNDLLGNGDNRVIINLRFTSDFSLIDELVVREGNGSGHQDGRRTGITNRVMTVNGEENCQLMAVAFTAVLATPGDPNAANLEEGVFVAELQVCDPDPCTSCLCSTDPDCGFGELSLGAGPDFDQNGVVDDTDLNLMMMALGYTKGRFDMDRDGIVGEKDVAMLMKDYGKVVETK